MVDKRYSALVIEGSFTAAELQSAWFVIVDQYNAAIGDHEGKLFLSLYKAIALKETDLKTIELLAGADPLGILRITYVEDMAKELNTLLGTKFVFDPSDAEKYLALLDRCVRRAKGLQLDLDRRKMEFESIQAKKKVKGKVVEVSREYFQTILINLSDYAKYTIDDKVTTFEFCERVRRLSTYLDKAKK